ncbi:MAG: uncharacterized protein QG596_1228 [Actinomycetota bacterium]|jgi:uncharacterized membrane protein (UPF0127 family)|nr:uncharacterized protein [Actinomycetota bacterium]
MGMAIGTDITRPARRFRRLEVRRVHGFEVPVAKDPVSRLLGLAMLDRHRAPEGLLIPGCRSVHTYGMRFPLDLLFLGPGQEPMIAVREVGPGHRVRVPEADSVLELPSDWDIEKWECGISSDGDPG